MIGARRYREDDFDQFEGWWQSHGVKPPPNHSYPDVGFIVDNIAAAFLYQTDSSICLIESIIYNPNIDKESRTEALDECIECVVLEAMGMGFKTLIGFTEMQAVINRAEKFNFQKHEQKYTMVTKDLNPWDL